MLPFLEPKKAVSVIVARRGKSDLEASPEVEAPGSEMDPGLKEAASDLMRALDERSVMGVAQALKAAFDICDSYDDEEDSSPMEGMEE